MKIAMGCDHGGFHLKEHIKKYLQEKGIEVVDHGTYSEASVDYPDFAKSSARISLAAKAVQKEVFLSAAPVLVFPLLPINARASALHCVATYSLRKCPVSITMLMFCAWASAFWALAWQR